MKHHHAEVAGSRAKVPEAGHVVVSLRFRLIRPRRFPVPTPVARPTSGTLASSVRAALTSSLHAREGGGGLSALPSGLQFRLLMCSYSLSLEI